MFRGDLYHLGKLLTYLNILSCSERGLLSLAFGSLLALQMRYLTSCYCVIAIEKRVLWRMICLKIKKTVCHFYLKVLLLAGMKQ